MSAILKTITINTLRMQDLVAFYKLLGVTLLPAPVNRGSVTYRGSAGDVEICLISISKKDKALTPNLSLRFKVKNVAEILKQLRKLNDIQIVMEPQETQHGLAAVLLDPEGHSVEIFEA